MPRETAASGRSYSCPHYRAAPGGKRCVDYEDGGACARPDQFMCAEWMRLNERGAGPPKKPARIPPGPPQPRLDPGTLDLFGNRGKDPAPEVERKPQPERRSNPACAEAAAGPAAVATNEVPLVRTLSDHEIGALAEAGVEVCMESDGVAPFWLVPELTDSDRHELTFQHGATLAAICAAFPGTKVTSMKWAARKAAVERSSKDDGNSSAKKGAAR